MVHDTPAAFSNHKAMLQVITNGLSAITDASEAMDRLLENIATALKNLKVKSEASGWDASTMGDGIDEIVETLSRSGHKIVSDVIENTELDA